MGEVYESVAVHDYAEYTQGCVNVLDEEWARSASSRLAMLAKSSSNLPYSIALLERNIDNETCEVIGHSRLCRVHQQPTAGFVESVVIRKDRRGKGLGRKIMEETEEHARRLGLSTLYLCTHDKQDFYQHLGYQFCAPVLSFGSASNILSEQQLSKLVDGLGLDVHRVSENDTKKILSQVHSERCPPNDVAALGIMPSPSSPPPPAPPLPCQQSAVTRTSCYWLMKALNT